MATESLTTQKARAVKPKGRQPMSRRSRQEAIEGYLFLLPNLLGFIIFMAVPLALSFYYSFTDYNLFNPPKFIGLANYLKALGFQLNPEAFNAALAQGKTFIQAFGKYLQPNDPLFWTALRNTIVYAVGVLVFSVIPAFFLAWLLNSRLRGMTIYRALFYIPVVASIVGVALIWFWIYNRDSGVINTIITSIVNALNSIGIPIEDPQIGWLVDPKFALFSLVIMTAWATVGYDMVVFLAALQGIPTHLFEAATVDGASRWDTLVKIVLPLITPTLFFVLVTNTITVLQVFSEPYIMTLGGPANSTLTIVFYLYQKGFQRFQMGYGTSLAWLVFALIYFITTVQFKLAERWVYEE